MKRLAILACLLALAMPVAHAQTIVGKVYNGTATHAAATATVTPPTNQHVIVYSVTASCASTPASPVLVQLKDGTTVIASWYVTAKDTTSFPGGASLPAGDTANAVLADCGSAVVGSINLNGAIR